MTTNKNIGFIVVGIILLAIVLKLIVHLLPMIIFSSIVAGLGYGYYKFKNTRK